FSLRHGSFLTSPEHDAPPGPWRASVQLTLTVVFEGETALRLRDDVERPRQGGRVVDVDGRTVADRLRDSASSGSVGGGKIDFAHFRFLLLVRAATRTSIT